MGTYTEAKDRINGAVLATPRNKHYSREITMPATKKEGLTNTVQMIINEIENGDSYEALMVAVNLMDDLLCNSYGRDATETATMAAVVQKELQVKHDAELARAKEIFFAAGRESMKNEILGKLGLGS